MKPLPLACFAAALFLVGIGILHHDQVKTRNAAARQVHEEKMEKHWQQAAKARHDEVDRQLAADQRRIEMITDRRKTEISINAAEQEAREKSVTLWRNLASEAARDSELELRAAQEAADKDRGF